MSVAEAEEFYGPVREVLRARYGDIIRGDARQALEEKLKFKISPEIEKKLGEMLGPSAGDNQFDNIIRFMSGRTSRDCEPDTRTQPGTEKCIALVYEGPDAVRKIRDVLGPTDPSKAPPGSIRREFGQSVMINAAHASDSEENAQREMGIIRIGQENTFRKVVESAYGSI